MSEEKTGLRAAVEQIMDAQDGGPGGQGEQLALLPLDRVEGTAATRRGAGRPPGAKNKRTEEWTDWLLSNYRSPLEGLAQACSMSVRDLAELLSCKPLEAYKLQIEAAKALAPYLHQKQAVAVDLKSKNLVQLVIGELPELDGEGGEGDIVVLDNSEENQ